MHDWVLANEHMAKRAGRQGLSLPVRLRPQCRARGPRGQSNRPSRSARVPLAGLPACGYQSSVGPWAIPTSVHTCLITSNVKRLVDFYEPILGLTAKWSGKAYAEFLTGGGVLAIFSQEAQEEYIPGSTDPAKNKSVVLEFRVGDVDQEYRRLQRLSENLGQAAWHTALGNAFHLLPRPGRKSCRFLYVTQWSITNVSVTSSVYNGLL